MRKRIANIAALLGALALAGALLAGAAALFDGARTAHAQESGGEQQQANAEGQAEDGGVRGQDDVDLFCADGGTTRSVLAGSIQTVSCEVSNDTGYNIRLSVSRTGGVQEVSRSLGSRRSNGTRPVTVRVRVNSPGSVTIRAEDHQDWDEDTIDFTITDSMPTFGTVTISNKSWTHNKAISSFRLPAATGGDGTLRYSISPALPSGVRRSNFTVSGTPNALKTSTAYTWTATDADGDTATRSFNIEVLPQVTISRGTSPITEGTSARFTLTASAAPLSNLTVNVRVTQSGSFISGTPPTSVQISSGRTTGRLTVQTRNDSVDEPHGSITARVLDGTGYVVGTTFSAKVTVEDNEPDPTAEPDLKPSFSATISNKSWTHNKAVSFNLPAATGGDGDLSYSLTPALPSGVTRSGRAVSGTPNALKASTAYTWTATDADGDTATRSFNIEVLPQVSIAAGTSPIAERTTAQFTLTASAAPPSNLAVSVSVTQSGSFISGTAPTSVTIPANRTTATLSVPTLKDKVNEADGSISAAVQAGTNYVVGSPSSASVSVRDTPYVSIAAGTSPITEGANATFTITAAGAPLSNMTVSVSVTQSGSFIKGTAPSSVTIPANGTSVTLTVPTKDDSTDEQNGSITASVVANAAYELGSAFRASVAVQDNDLPKLAAPTGLTITPLPQRKARLDWGTVASSARYQVEVRKAGGSWAAAPSGSTTSASYEITLDSIVSNGDGLAHASAYQFRVKAIASGSTHADSDYSALVEIRDTPIASINGDSDGRSIRNARAVVKWNAVPGATAYTLRWRELPRHGVPGRFLGIGITNYYSHTNTLWRPNGATSESDWSEPLQVSGSTHTVDGLSLDGRLYAFQLNYTFANGQGFSAREAYVWPAKGFPPTRVATYPFFGHWEGGRYSYTICLNTFPTTPGWENLITSAIGAWSVASDGLITTSPTTSNACGTTPLNVLASLFNERNEVIMVDTTDANMDSIPDVVEYEDFNAFVQGFADSNLLWQIVRGGGALLTNQRQIRYTLPYCVFHSSGCVISPSYVRVRGPQASVNLTRASGSVDILLPNSTQLSQVPSNVQFNSCEGNFDAYETILHEAGHALGISGFSLAKLKPAHSAYVMAHPTIDDSVLNYAEFIQNKDEPDCSPYPFDIMAIYALYQSID